MRPETPGSETTCSQQPSKLEHHTSQPLDDYFHCSYKRTPLLNLNGYAMGKRNRGNWIALALVAASLSAAARLGGPSVYNYLTGLTATGQFESGLRYAQQGNPTAEEQAFQKALSIDPDYAPAHINLSLIHIRRGEWVEAKRHAENVITNRPFDYRGYFNRGVSLWGENDLEGALSAIDRAIELWRDPDVPTLWNMEPKRDLYVTRASINKYLRRFRDGVADLDKLIAINLVDRSVNLLRAELLRQQGDLGGALNILNPMLDHGENDWYRALRERAKVREGQGDEAGAAADRQLADRNAPSQVIIERGQAAIVGR